MTSEGLRDTSLYFASTSGVSTVYNFEVAVDQNYFVSGSPNGPWILVHNGCGKRGDGGGGPPNPHGSKGKPDHQQKVNELEDKAGGELGPGEEVLRERRIQTDGNSKRVPDVQILDKDGKTRKVFEAERHPTRKRNREREAEYDRLGVERETHPVGPKP